MKWPFSLEIDKDIWKDHEWWAEGHSLYPFRKYTVVQRLLAMDRVVVAPGWIAWLYRILPNHANVNLTAWRKIPSYFLANIAAPTWRIGIRMGVKGRNIPALSVEIGDWQTYLPWGVKLYARMCRIA